MNFFSRYLIRISKFVRFGQILMKYKKGIDMKNQKEIHKSKWTFLTNHSHVLLCLVENPNMKMREIAEKVGLTERAVQGIIADLRQEDYIDREKNGRRNIYHIHTKKHLKHPLEEH